MEKSSRIARALSRIRRTPWAILEEYLTTMPEQIAAAMDTEAQHGRPDRSVRVGSTQLIPIRGVITHHSSLWELFGFESSTERIGQQLREAADDDDIKAVVLDFDSPGGTTTGVEELAAQVREVRKAKPVVAVANSLLASAAYHIASGASEIVALPSGDVGSIGVFIAHLDWSEFEKKMGVKTTLVTAGKRKAEFDFSKPLTDEARERLQSIADQVHAIFLKDVAKGRGVSVSTVRKDFGQGRLFLAREALAVGMVDRLGTLEETLLRVSGPGRGRVGKKRSALSIREFEDGIHAQFGFTREQAKAVSLKGFKAAGELEPREEASTGDSDPREEAEELRIAATLDNFAGAISG